MERSNQKSKREDHPDFKTLVASRGRAKTDKVPDAGVLAVLKKHKDATGHVPIEQCLACAAALDALPRPAKQDEKPDRQTLALAMAAKGFRVFACKPNSKEPACYWQQEATTDPAVIRSWPTDANYGVAMDAEHLVLDLDCKGDTNGRDALGGLEIDYDAMPPTFRVRTPSGGEHLYLTGNAPNSVRKKSLGGAIDIRGAGGYVLGPGSTIDGKSYEITEDHDIAPAPDWILKLAAKTTVEPATRDPNVELDTSGEISRTRSYLKTAVAQGDVAIEFCGGNDRTYKLFNAILDHVSQDVAYDLVAGIWNPACVPPWSDDELRTILDHAVTHRQNEIGAKASKPATEAFAEPLADLPAEPFAKCDETPPNGMSPDEWRRLRYKYRLRDPVEEANRPPLTFWDSEQLYIRTPEGAILFVYGDTGTHKTGVHASKAIDLVFNHPSKPRVLFFAGEGPYGFGQARIPAICKHYGRTIDDLKTTGRFHQVSAAPMLLSDNDMAAIAAELKLSGFRPDIIVIETFSRAVAGNYNAPDVFNKAYQSIDGMREAFNALVIVSHHEGKDVARGMSGNKQLECSPDTVLYQSLVNDTTVEVHVEKMRDGRDDFSIGYRVSRASNGTPVLAVMSDADLKAAKQGAERTKAKSRDETQEIINECLGIYQERKVTNWDSAIRETSELADLLCEKRHGRKPMESQPDLLQTWKTWRGELFGILSNGSRAHGGNKKIRFGHICDRQSVDGCNTLSLRWFPNFIQAEPMPEDLPPDTYRTLQ